MLKKDGLLFFLFLSLVLLHLGQGSSEISIWDLFLKDSAVYQQILSFRIHRIMSCLLVGGSLAVSGLYFQSFLKNPLAEPFTMGFSGASALGIALGIYMGVQSPFLIAGLGFVFCLLAVGFILNLQKRVFHNFSADLILIGICLGFFCNALVIVLQSVFRPEELQVSYQWLIGSLEHFRTSYWFLCVLPIFSLLYTQLKFGKQLDKLHLGKSMASAMGTPLAKIQNAILISGALVCGVSVYLCGIIAFLGFIAPHLTKSFYQTSLHSKLFIRCFLIGACLLVFSDLLAMKLSFETSLPTGGIISLLGVPFFFKILIGDRSYAKN